MAEEVAPASREAEIAARLEAGYPAHDVGPRDGYVSPLDDLRYLLAELQQAREIADGEAKRAAEHLAQLQQARQELERLRPMAERYLDIKEGR